MDSEVNKLDESRLLAVMNYEQTGGDTRDSFIIDPIHHGFSIAAPGQYRYDTESRREDAILALLIISGVVSFCLLAIHNYTHGFPALAVTLFLGFTFWYCRDYFLIDRENRKLWVCRRNLAGTSRRPFLDFNEIDCLTIGVRVNKMDQVCVRHFFLQLKDQQDRIHNFSNRVQGIRLKDLRAVGAELASLLDTSLHESEETASL